MSEWIVRRGVPILDEHELRDEEGKPTMQIDARKLAEIARKNNERVAKTGDLTPIVIGHTKDDAPEHAQPELVGYACNFRVGPLFQTGKKAILADFKFMADKADKVKGYPRRSVELWLSDWKIDPIALLGATTPERDLGLLQLSSGGRKKVKRYMNDPQQAPVAPGQQPGGLEALIPELIAALEQTDVFQWVKQQMQQEAAMDAAPPLPLGPEAGMDPMMGDMGMDGPPLPPEIPGEDFGDDEDDYDDEDDDQDDEDEDEEDDEEDEEKPVKRSAVASAPSGTNTYLPRGIRQMSRPTQPQHQPQPAPRHYRQAPVAPQRPVQYGRLDPTEARIQLMARAQQAQNVRYQRVLRAMAEEMDELKLRYARAEREKDLVELESEGILFDRVEELDFVMGLDDEQYARHLEKMRHRYQKAPVARYGRFADYSAPGAARSAAAGPQPTSKSDADKIADYALQHGLSYNEAKAKLFSS